MTAIRPFYEMQNVGSREILINISPHLFMTFRKVIASLLLAGSHMGRDVS